jgi:hypothetical protein
MRRTIVSFYEHPSSRSRLSSIGIKSKTSLEIPGAVCATEFSLKEQQVCRKQGLLKISLKRPSERQLHLKRCGHTHKDVKILAKEC